MKKKIIAIICILVLARFATMVQSQNSAYKAQCCAVAATLGQPHSHNTTEVVDVTNGYTETLDVRTDLDSVTLTPGETKKISRPSNCKFELYYQRSGQSEIRTNCMHGITFQSE